MWLKSPFNGEVFPMEFVPGVPPTLEAMLKADFVRVDKPTEKESSHGERE